jgi:hypothetical protein
MTHARLYAGTTLLITASVIRAVWSGDWTVVLLVMTGLLLVIASFSLEEGRR